MSVRFVLRVCQVCVHLAHVELTAAIQLIILALVLESAASFFTSLTSPDTLDLMNVRTSSWSFVIGFCVVLRRRARRTAHKNPEARFVSTQ